MTRRGTIQPHAARACCAVVGSSKKRKRKEKGKGELDPPYEGPRPLVTFPILLGTPLPGQSRRPRGTPHPPLQPLTFQLFSSSREEDAAAFFDAR